MHRVKIEPIIKDAIASEVEKEMSKWGLEDPRVGELCGALRAMVVKNDVLLEGARVQLDNT